MTGHALSDVSWITVELTGWKDAPEGGKFPIRSPLGTPHSRWYCECGSISGRYTGATKKAAQDKARRGHAEHVSTMERSE